MTIYQRIIQILIAFSQLLNTLLGLFIDDGWADESVSAKAYRLRHHGWHKLYKLINFIFFKEDDHCKASYIAELKSRHLPPEYRMNK